MPKPNSEVVSSTLPYGVPGDSMIHSNQILPSPCSSVPINLPSPLISPASQTMTVDTDAPLKPGALPMQNMQASAPGIAQGVPAVPPPGYPTGNQPPYHVPPTGMPNLPANMPPPPPGHYYVVAPGPPDERGNATQMHYLVPYPPQHMNPEGYPPQMYAPYPVYPPMAPVVVQTQPMVIQNQTPVANAARAALCCGVGMLSMILAAIIC